MKPCLLCEINEMYYGLLCKECIALVSKNKKVAKEWERRKGRKSKTLKRFRKKLLYKIFPSQKRALKYIRKVANVYWIKIQPERIYGSYIIDIYIPRLKVGIEIDGGIHKTQIGYDDFKDEYLKRHGIIIYRFENKEIGTSFFKNAIWQIFNINHIDTHYNKILERAGQNNINLNLI